MNDRRRQTRQVLEARVLMPLRLRCQRARKIDYRLRRTATLLGRGQVRCLRKAATTHAGSTTLRLHRVLRNRAAQTRHTPCNSTITGWRAYPPDTFSRRSRQYSRSSSANLKSAQQPLGESGR